MTLTDKQMTKAPFPWFGGKSQAAPLVWSLLGDVDHYVEPFAGALGVLINRPHPCNRSYHSETVNDLDGFIVNAWRAIQWHPEEVARWASWPVTEADKTARLIACLKWRDEATLDLLAGSPEWCDPKIAGWWLYGICAQIGAIGGPWTADPDTGRIVKQGRGVRRGLPHLTGNRGVNHVGTREPGVSRNLPHLSNNGMGVNHAGTREPGVTALDAIGDDVERFHDTTMPELIRWMRWLSARLRHVRVVNGDWSRVCTTGAAHTLPVRQGGHAGLFLDPPYDTGIRASKLYDHESDGASLPDAVRAWAIKAGDNPRNRIVVAGYAVEHVELEEHGWTVHEWFTAGFLAGGMGNVNQGDGTHQQHRERLWASPHCLNPDPDPPEHEQLDMWEGE